MGVITISRQFGSLGDEVAAAAAERLGYRLVARDLINQAARRAAAPVAALAEIDELMMLDACPSKKDCRAYHEAVRDVVLELASAGDVVIVGRGGQVILRDHPAALHARVIAPAPLRAWRIAEVSHISLEAAAAQVAASDRFLKSYLKRYYRVAWDDPELYDLVINTERTTPAAAAELLQVALQSRLTPATLTL
jgi:cytidylate kinase